MHIHICLVSQQLLANYIPIRMDKPDQVHLVSSLDMQKKGLTTRFETLLKQSGFNSVTHTGMPDAGMAEIQRFTRALYETLTQQYPTARLTVNITGGTKLMSVSMLDIFSAAGHAIIYTDTAKDTLERVHNCTLEPLPAVLGIEEYLLAYGATVHDSASWHAEWQERAFNRRAAAELLAQITQTKKLQALITVLNAMAMSALSFNGDELVAPQQAFKFPLTTAQLAAVQPLAEAGLFALHDNHQDVMFLDAERTRFICGHWLEEYAWHIAEQAGLNEVACGVDIDWENSRTCNELDVLAVHNNRLLIIECKTVRFSDDRQKSNNTLYKINSLGESLRGLFGQKVLLSAWEVSSTMLDRAKTQGIKILRPHELAAYIQQWSGVTA